MNTNRLLFELIFDNNSKLSFDLDDAKRRLTIEMWQASESNPDDWSLAGKACLRHEHLRRVMRVLTESKIFDTKAQ